MRMLGSRQKYTRSSCGWVEKARDRAVSNSVIQPSGKVIFSVSSPRARVNQDARKFATRDVPMTTAE